MTIAINEDDYREVLGIAEGIKEDKTSWVTFFKWLKGRGLDGVKLVVSGKNAWGMLKAVEEAYAVKTAVYQLGGMQIETSEIVFDNNRTAADLQIYGVEAAT